jgi:hypothetical protein
VVGCAMIPARVAASNTSRFRVHLRLARQAHVCVVKHFPLLSRPLRRWLTSPQHPALTASVAALQQAEPAGISESPAEAAQETAAEAGSLAGLVEGNVDGGSATSPASPAAKEREWDVRGECSAAMECGLEAHAGCVALTFTFPPERMCMHATIIQTWIPTCTHT